MKKKILLLILLFSVLFVFGEEGKLLNEVLKPDSLLVSDGYVYILEGAKCHIYSEKENKIVRSVGKAGAGPGEVKIGPGFPLNSGLLSNENIYLEGMSKLIVLTKNGDYLNEIKKKGRIFKSAPLGKNFVGVRFSADPKIKKNYISLALYKSDYSFFKEINRQEIKDNDTDIEMIVDSIHFSVYKDRLYVEDSKKGFIITVFDTEGVELYSIEKEIASKKINDLDKKKLMSSFKEDDFITMMVKRDGGWNRFEKKMKFLYPEYFPSIQDISVIKNKIYVLTFKSDKDKEKFIVMDLKGKILKTIFLPVPIKANYLSKMMGRDNKFYGFNSKFYYYLEEDEETETFKLKKIKL